MTDLEKNQLLRYIRPVHLISALTLYLIGAGLARYLGARIDIVVLGWGFSWLSCLFAGVFLLGDYFNLPFVDPVFPTSLAIQQDGGQPEASSSNLVLFGALAFYSAAGVLTVFMGLRGLITPAVGAVLMGCFGFSALLVAPGLNLKFSGIGEFVVSICLVVFPPALSFLTQYGEFHRFLTLSIFPLFPLHLALILTLCLRSFPEDIRANRKTLIVRLGWVRGVFLHNMLLLSAFVLFSASLLFGLPLRIIGPVFLTMIPAGTLIWMYSGLEHGAPVRWPLIIFLAVVVFFLPLYLIAFTAWVF